MRDLKSNISPAVSIAPDGDRTASVNGAGVDLRGYESAAAVVHLGTITDGGWTAKIQESDDDSAYADAADVVGSFTEATSSSDGTTQTVVYIGGKRYIRVVVTESTPTPRAVSSPLWWCEAIRRSAQGKGNVRPYLPRAAYHATQA